MELIHLADDNGANVRCGEGVGVALSEAKLRHDSRGELNRQTPISQRVRDPPDLRHIFRAHQLEVAHDRQGDLVAHPCGGHVARHLRELPRIGAEDCGHGVRDGFVVHQELQLSPVKLRVPICIVLAYELRRLLARECIDRVERANILQVLDGDGTSVGHIEKAEGLMQHIVLAPTIATELGHDFIVHFLHLVQCVTERLDASQDLVPKLEDPLAHLCQCGLDLDEKHVQKLV
mmetsp:Transcript_39322/g.85610  ORF Transcript_39322/g.85610 Transcript_39322/m.85610 type:complete len:233 (+) Transcript_39322:2003-2701(+)